jgi:hypothetical protein
MDTENRVALDTPALRRLVDALTTQKAGVPDDETIALVRIHLYVTSALVVPTVSDELEEEGAAGTWRNLHFHETARQDDYFHGCVKGRTETYLGYHPDPRDCHVVAEAECAKAEAFITTAGDLLTGLAGKTESIAVMSPTQYWRKVKPAPGTAPRIEPNPESPLARVTWWKW